MSIQGVHSCKGFGTGIAFVRPDAQVDPNIHTESEISKEKETIDDDDERTGYGALNRGFC